MSWKKSITIYFQYIFIFLFRCGENSFSQFGKLIVIKTLILLNWFSVFQLFELFLIEESKPFWRWLLSFKVPKTKFYQKSIVKTTTNHSLISTETFHVTEKRWANFFIDSMMYEFFKYHHSEWWKKESFTEPEPNVNWC